MIENLLKAVGGLGRVHLLVLPKYVILKGVVNELKEMLEGSKVKCVFKPSENSFYFPSGSIYKLGVVESKFDLHRYQGYVLASVEFHHTFQSHVGSDLYNLARHTLSFNVRDQSGVHSRSDAAQYNCNQLGESRFSMSTAQIVQLMPKELLRLFETNTPFKPLVHFAWWVSRERMDSATRQRAARIDSMPGAENYFKIWATRARNHFCRLIIEQWASRFVRGEAAATYWRNESSSVIEQSMYKSSTYARPNGGRRTLPAFYTSLNKYWVRSTGEIVPPDTMNQGHLKNSAKLLRESHSNVQGQCSELLGNMRAHFRNSPSVCAKIDALLHEMLAVPVEQMYPVLLTLAKHLGDVDPPPVYDPKDIGNLDSF